LNASICADVFQKLVKTKPKQFMMDNGHVELLYKLGDYELFVEIGPEFRVDYAVKMVVTHDPNKVGG
jgi:hypothetical protein